MIVINRCNGTCRYLMKFTHDYANTCKDPRGIRNYVFVTSRTMLLCEDGCASLLSWENKATYEISREKTASFCFFSPLTDPIGSNYLIQPTSWTRRQFALAINRGVYFQYFSFSWQRFQTCKIVCINRVE